MVLHEFYLHFIVSIVLTWMVSSVVLWRYRATVLRGMRTSGGSPLPIATALPASPGTYRETVDARTALRWERRARRRIAAAYLLSVGIPALVWAGVFLAPADMPKTPAHFLMVWGVFVSLAAPMIAISLALPARRAVQWWLALLTTAAVALVAVSMLQRLAAAKAPTLDQVFNAVDLFRLAAVLLWAPALCFLATGSRRLRGIAPITLAGLLAFGLAPIAGVRALFASAATTIGTDVIAALNSAWLAVNGGFLVLALPTAGLAWLCMSRLAAAYEAKRFSDAQLLATTFWLVVMMQQGAQLAISRPDPWLTVIAAGTAFLLFPFVNHLAFARFGIDVGRPPPWTLLLLRVFGDTRRTERLFDRVAARWRLFGPITTIAAPDIVARTVDPGDFLRFVGGRASEVFVRSRDDLDARLDSLDRTPDPDGRYRVNEFCCGDDTWQATVVALMLRADAVVMDVRSLTADRRGCEFELQQLAARLPAKKIVLVVDAATDIGLLAAAMGDRHAEVSMIRVDRGTVGESERVFNALVAAAASPG